jgi:hypothetical protein
MGPDILFGTLVRSHDCACLAKLNPVNTSIYYFFEIHYNHIFPNTKPFKLSLPSGFQIEIYSHVWITEKMETYSG